MDEGDWLSRWARAAPVHGPVCAVAEEPLPHSATKAKKRVSIVHTAIYGPGGFGRELILANPARSAEGVVFISDDVREIGSSVEGVPVLSLEEAARRGSPAVVIAVADAHIRRKLAEKVAGLGLAFGVIRPPSVVVGAGVQMGEGAILCDFTMITASAKIGRHFQANIYSYVAHDCVIGNFVTLAPRVCINGNTIVEDDAYIGTGAILKQGTPQKPLRIGRGAMVGMGAVVTKDVPAGAVVIGNPARLLDRT